MTGEIEYEEFEEDDDDLEDQVMPNDEEAAEEWERERDLEWVREVLLSHIGPWGVSDLYFTREDDGSLWFGSANERAGAGYPGDVVYAATEGWNMIRELGEEERCLPDGMLYEAWVEAGEDYDALDEVKMKAVIDEYRMSDPDALLHAAGHPPASIEFEI